jgi:hypothetical protein
LCGLRQDGPQLIRKTLGRRDETRMVPEDSQSDIAKLAEQAFWHFDAAIDYIWKVPTFLETQEQIETEKLEEFADAPRLREWRRRFEFYRLLVVFPELVATSNLFVAVSLLEFYLLRLAGECVRRGRPSFREMRGQGIARFIAYFRQMGAQPERLGAYSDVKALLTIRNCLMHASGMLSQSRDAEEVRRIVAERLYLPANVRTRASERTDSEVTILETPLGDRLQITNTYAWLSCCMCRDFFVSLCSSADRALG